MPGALLNMLVKDKLPHSREVPVNTKEWQLKPPRREKRRLQQKSTRECERMAAETPEERERRLQWMSTNQHERLAVETPEERERRLQRMSTNQHERLAVETPEERERRLQRMSTNQHERLAAETPEERERLQRISTNQHERLAVETPEERETRLQRMSTNQRERLAVETPEKRELRLECYSTRYELRLECYSTRYMEQQSVPLELPLFQQCSIQAKMRKFHANMATLDTLTCSTCSERFPGLHFHSKSDECLHCSRDKHIPKIYSSANNMNPGPIPPQLQVSNTDTCIHIGALTQQYCMLALINYDSCCIISITTGGQSVKHSPRCSQWPDLHK